MQFLQINFAKMRGNRVVKVAGEPYIAIPLANLYAASREAVYGNFIMNETTAYGHTFVISERRGREGERMPIIGNASPYAPMSKDDAEVVEDSAFGSVANRPADGAGESAPTPGTSGGDSDSAPQGSAATPSGVDFDPATGEIKNPKYPF